MKVKEKLWEDDRIPPRRKVMKCIEGIWYETWDRPSLAEAIQQFNRRTKVRDLIERAELKEKGYLK